MDDKEASNAKLNDELTCREHVTSSLQLPVSKSARIKNSSVISGHQRKSLPLDEATKPDSRDDELIASSLLSPDSYVTALETKDSDAVENATSNENYTRLADDEDEICSDEIDDDEKTRANVETSTDFQMSGIVSFFFNVIFYLRQRRAFLDISKRCGKMLMIFLEW